MANKPQDINPFAQFVEQPKQEPNPFEQFVKPQAQAALSPEEQMMSSVGADSSAGWEMADYGKLIGAGAIKGTLAAPEAVQASASGMARDTVTKPTEILNYLSDPRKLANDLAQSVRLPKIFEEDAKAGIVPEETVKKQKIAVDEALTQGKLQSLRSLTEYGNKVAERIEDSVTPEMKLALAESQPTGNIIEAFQTGDFSKISLGTKPSLLGITGQASKVFGTAAPGILTSIITKSATPGAVFGFGQAASEGVDTAREYIGKMSDEELAKNSEYFRNLLVMGYTPELARKMTEDKAGDTAAYYQGIVGALGGAFTGNLVTGKLDKALLSSAKTRLGKITQGIATGAAEEGFQELAEGIATDLGIDKTVVREMGVDSFANMVLGAIGGGGPGGVRGMVSKIEPKPGEVTPSVVPESVAGVPTKIAEAELEGEPPAAKPTETQEVQPSVTPVTVDPELKARATMKWQQLIMDADEGKKFNVKEMNQLARDLGIEPSKNREDTAKAISETLGITPVAPKEQAQVQDETIQKPIEDVKLAKNEVFVPVVDDNGDLTDQKDTANLDKLYFEDGQVWVEGAEYDHELSIVLDEIRDEAVKADLIKRAEAVVPKATEVLNEEKVKATTAPVKEAPKAEVAEEEERVLTPEEVDKKYAGASKQVDRIKELSNIGDEDRTDEENDFLDAARRELYRTAERISGPPRKKGYVSSSHIDVNQFGDKWVSGSTYMGSTGGYGVGVSYDSTPYDTREEAINAEIDKMRSYAESQKDTVTLKWLDSLDKRKPKVLTKEEKAAENRKRQEEKKRASQQVAEEESEDEDEDADESGTYDITKDKDAEVILSPNSNVKLFVKEITDPKYPEYVGKWLYDSQIKTNGGSMFGGKTPKSSPISAANRKDAIKKSLEKAQSQEFYLNKKGKRDQSIEDFVQSIAKKEGIDLESYDQREERYKKEAAEKKAAEKAEANRKRQEEKKAKAAAEKEAAKKAEAESFEREMQERREREAAVSKQLKEQSNRSKEAESIDITELEDTEGIPARDLKQFKDKVEDAGDEYGDALRAYIRTGQGKDVLDKAVAEYNKAIKEFNDEVAQIRGEEAAEEAPKAAVKETPKAEVKPKAKRDILTKATDIYELALTLQNISEDDNKDISDFTDKEIVDEAKYVLSTYNESGHANNDELIGEAGPEAKKNAQKEVNKLKQLIKKYEVKEAPKDEVKEEPKAAEEKPAGKLVPALPLNQEWATGRDYEITPEKFGQEVYDYYEQLKSGDFGFTRVSYTGANALKRENQTNKERKANYDKAARLFLGRTITTKTPTKKQAKIEVPDGLFVTPLPVAKQIKDVGKSVEDQKAAMFDITAPKDEVRVALKGVLVEPDTIVATDGHRMAILTANTGVKKNVILDKDGKEIDSSYPNYKLVAKKASDVEANIGVNATALGDYARGVSKAAKFIVGDNALPLSLNNKLYSFNAKYVEDMTNLFKKFGYDEFFINVGDDKMLVAKSPDNKLVQYIMGMRDNQNVFMPFDVLAGEPGVNRPEVIEGEGIIREITSREVKLIENATNKLSDSEIATLEEHYGITNYSMDFAKRVREDAVKYINQGAEAVDKAIRSIISKVAAAILSVAIVFNPNYMSDASAVALPQVVTKTVQATVPTDVKGMSESGQKAYSILYPALKQGLQKNNKYFTVIDKPTSKAFVFNPDGSLMTQSNVVLGKAFGDFYVGKTDFKQNRITPGGNFIATAEKGSATYDGKTVYTIGNEKEGWNVVFMHTVYLKESDAKDRLQALETGEGTRLSHGCVNGPTDLMQKIDNPMMDKSHVFIVPDNQAAVDDFIANRVSNEDLTRETVTPVTEKVPVPTAPKQGQKEMFAREEEAEKPPKTQAEINRERQQRKQAMLKAESPYYGSFTNNIDEASIGKTREQIKKEKSESSRKVKHSLTKILRTVVKGEASIKTQRDATEMLDARTELNKEKKYARVRMDSAIWFAAQADKDAQLHKAYPNDPKYGLEPEVAAVIRDVATKYPKLLEGLKLGIKQAGESGVAGNFNPFNRLVTLFKDTSGTSDPKTFRHELMHSIEQMMPDDVYQMVIDNWAKSLGKAVAKHTDKPHKAYFDAVLDYVENPTEENKRKAENLMPSYDMYQYMNPSEFWAVNAEKLFASKLGGRWENFKRAISKLFEGLKSVFGFNNTYGVHKAFDRLFKGPMERGESKRMLVDYIMRNNPDAKYEFLSNFEEYDNRREAEGRSEAIIKTSPSVLDRFLGAFKGAKRTWKHVIANPAIPTSNMGGKLARALTYVRVKNVWYAKGLEVMEAKLYGGKLRDGMNKAIASVAVTNALHAGHIGSEVILRGKLIFNEASQMFQAVRDKFSMANVMMAKHDLIERVGLQRANNMIQDYFEAKRSRSIIEEFLKREGEFAELEAAYEAAVTDEEKSKLRKELVEAEKGLKAIDVARKKVNMDDEQIDFYSSLEDENPELRTMMDNWTAVNHNMIDNMEMSNLISKKRAAQLRSIKDYVPWYRIKDNMEEVHSPAGAVRSLTNVAQEKKFGDYETDLDIDDIVDNMLHNVMVLTRNSIRNHAANQVAMAYATRNEKGKIVRFGEEGIGPNGEVRTNVVINGKRTIIEIKDPLVAQSVLGMESVAIPGLEIFGMIANNLRRGVTLWPQFQLKQLFMDAPTAALVSGVKNPHAVYADTFRSFIKALNSNDPVVDMLKSYGIGGYQSVHRAPEQMYKQKIGLLEQNKLDKVLDVLDRVSDSSDYAQRIAIYNRVMKETNGDQLQAIMQANNVIDFMKHGSGSIAQFLSRTVSFMNAYAQQIDVLAETLASGGLKGKNRAAARAQLIKTGGLLAFYSMMYCWAVGDDDEYQKLDDQTKLRNFFISKKITGFKEDLLIPMSTSASFFFKSIPELTYNYIITKGTKNEHDAARVRRALGKAAIDALLGPNPVPTGVKPFVEIGLNHNFLTGSTVTPKGLEKLESAEQYNASTSELGKIISAASFGALNPIQADHLVRGLFGTTGSMVMYGSNLFNGERATPQAKDNPMYGGLVAADVARGPEDLFYDLRDRAEEKQTTFNKLHERGRHEEADKYLEKNRSLIEAAGYTTDVGNALKEINKEIRRLGESAETGLNADQRREKIKEMQLEKARILEDISRYRREYGL